MNNKDDCLKLHLVGYLINIIILLIFLKTTLVALIAKLVMNSSISLRKMSVNVV